MPDNRGAYVRWGKRLLDVVAAGLGLALLSPLLAVVAALIRLEDTGPVFFTQARVGAGFRPFFIVKFRTMRQGGGGPQVTRDGDPRVTRIGRLLRSAKLDELPQLLNVLRGDMSLVGPRPEVPAYVELFRDEYERVLSVRPGITDFAAIRFRDESALLDRYDDAERAYVEKVLPEKLALYRRYLDELSLSTDLLILWATVLRVLFPSGHENLARSTSDRAAGPVIMSPMNASKRRLIVMSLDVAAVLAAYALSFLLSYDLRVDARAWSLLARTAAIPITAYAAAAYAFGVNRGLRFCASLGDAFDILKAVLVAAAVQTVAIRFLYGRAFPPAVLLSAPIVTAFIVVVVHAAARGASHFLYVHLLGGGRRRTAVIVGVGDEAELVYDTMRSDEDVDYRVLAFVNDGGPRFGVRLHGVRIVGGEGLARLLRASTVDEIVVAVDRRRRGRALDLVAEVLKDLPARPPVLVAPSADEMLDPSKRAWPRKVRPVDLLDRGVISLDAARIGRSIEGKVVLISGAGGTIGGELARQVARHKPRKMILLENNATALFFTEADLRELHPELNLAATLGDIRDVALVDRIFNEDKPQLVFHAAAHKHVHQLESNVSEGISNNLLGTYHLATAADRSGTEAFILISTDKAVRPTCVMGATKRAAEIVVSNFARTSKTRFASVRFGNVLGSSGSVMKIFQEQIEKGQPLTLTHPDATRYFMTVEEAVGLVLQASSLAKGGEIFVLNMGQPIRILDIARRLIWLSGLEPERDVPIRIVGLRAGEKIAEEIIEDPSGQEQSEHPDIMVLRSENRIVEELRERITNIEVLASTAERAAMIQALAQLVPTFQAAPGHDGVRVNPLEDKAHDASSN